MEAVPRLPMVSFEAKQSLESAEFAPKIRQYIRDHYGEDPESYNNEIHELDALRASAVRASADFTGCAVLKKYYCQLSYLVSRFPFMDNPAMAVTFNWSDIYTNTVYNITDIKYEMACILYNIATYHTVVGTLDPRNTPEGMRISCSHFQCAAWAFQHLRETYPLPRESDLSPTLMAFMSQVALAQAQECILEKSMTDNRKPNITAKIAMQVVEYLRAALKALDHGKSVDAAVSEIVGSKLLKNWRRYCEFKISYYRSVTLLYLGLQAEELQKMGERLSYYQAAVDQLQEATKLAKVLEQQEKITDCLTFTHDVMGGKLTAAKKENEFVYHEKVPPLDSLPEVKGASLVKGIPFNVTDVEISGLDIFARLVPIEAHHASSLYSEEKAKLLRRLCGEIQEKNDELEMHLSSMQLDTMPPESHVDILPQEVIECCADMHSRRGVQQLTDTMARISKHYHDIDTSLREVMQNIEAEEEKEKEFNVMMGSGNKRAPNMIVGELKRDALKYQEVHSSAQENNTALHKAITQHLPNLQLLSQPLELVAAALPSVAAAEAQGNPEGKCELNRLLGKVSEMQAQRATVESQLRVALQEDDITRLLVTSHQDEHDVFKEALCKHDKLVSVLEQNMTAQTNILQALSEANAAYAATRRLTIQAQAARADKVASLVTAHAALVAILRKSQDADNFYGQLENQVTKLAVRLQSVCAIQEEEREGLLSANARKFIAPKKGTSPAVAPQLVAKPLSGLIPEEFNAPAHPKLKDYLRSTVPVSSNVGIGDKVLGGSNERLPAATRPVDPATGGHPVSVRPSQVGSELQKPYPQQMPEAYNIAVGQIYPPSTSSPQFPSTNYQMPVTTGQYSMTMTGNPAHTAPLGGGVAMQVTSGANIPVGISNYQNYAYPMYNSFVTNPGDSTVRSAPIPNSTVRQQWPYATSSPAVVPTPNHYDQRFVRFDSYQPPQSFGSWSDSMTQRGSTYSQAHAENAALKQSTFGPIASPGTTQQGIYGPPSQLVGSHPATGYSILGHQPMLAGFSSVMVNQVPVSISASMVNCSPTHLPRPNVAPNIPSGDTPYWPGLHPLVTPSIHTAGLPEPPRPGTPGTPTGSRIPSASNWYQQSGGGTLTSTSHSHDAPYHQYPYGSVLSNGAPSQSFTAASNFPAAQYTNQLYHAVASTAPHQYMGSQMPWPQYSSAPVNVPFLPPTVAPIRSVAPSPKPIMNTSGVSNLDLLSDIDLSSTSKAAQWSPLTPESITSTDDSRKDTQEKIGDRQKPQVQGHDDCTTNVKSSNLAMQKDSVGQHENFGAANTPSILDLTSLMQVNRKTSLLDPLSDDDTLRRLAAETERLSKAVEGLPRRSLNGPTHLELRWKELHDDLEQECSNLKVSVARCYPLKNRFADILPFDQARVLLPSTRDDYINASHVQLKSVQEQFPMILTQAPLPSTYADFWTMIWEQMAELIVCLHTEAEVKGQVYWPSEVGQTIEYGTISVLMRSCREGSGVWSCQRILQMTHLVSKQTRVVIHLQFLAWPPSSMPDTPGPLLQLVVEALAFQRQQRNKLHPVVVQCVPGIGRSAVFAILCAFVREVNASGILSDISMLLLHLGKQRRGGIQDRDHLQWLYLAALYYVQDVLMKRGILTNKATFEEGPREKTHVRHPSADLLSSYDLSKMKMKLGFDQDSNRSDGDSRPNSAASIRSHESADCSVLPTREFSDSVSPIDEVKQDVKQPDIFASLPASLAASLDPAQFKLDPLSTNQKKGKITRESFDLPGGGRLGGSENTDDPCDPLSGLDPLWSMKKN